MQLPEEASKDYWIAKISWNNFLLKHKRRRNHLYGLVIRMQRVDRSTSKYHTTSIDNTNLLKLGLISDDEAVTISRPMDGGIIILTFSVKHYSELILYRHVTSRRKMSVRVGQNRGRVFNNMLMFVLPFVGIAL